jgi:hypothetical protein
MPAKPKFLPEFIEQAKKLAEMGHTDAEMADFFEVSLRSFHSWKVRHPEFFSALKVGKDQADERVKRSLFLTAVGFTHPETVVHFEKRTDKRGRTKIVPHQVEILKHYPPHAVSCIFWLKNRRPEDWREKFEHDHGLTASREKLQELLRAVEERIGAAEDPPAGVDRGPGRTQ